MTFCLTKGSLFGTKNALQQGPFLPRTKVSPIKNACFANVKLRIFRKYTESYLLRHFLVSFVQICLTKGSIFGADAPYLRVGSRISKWHTRIQKSGKSPPREWNQDYLHVVNNSVCSDTLLSNANGLISCNNLFKYWSAFTRQIHQHLNLSHIIRACNIQIFWNSILHQWT